MVLYVARHGETTWNNKKVISGRSNIDLSEKGYEQAERLAKEVAEAVPKITKIIHSPLDRAKETARIVAQYNQLPMIQDDRLIELDYGIYDGKSESTPEYLKNRTQFALRYPEGESLMDVYARVVPLLKELEADKTQCYLLVCHNSVIRAIKNYFEPLTNEQVFEYRTPNATLVSFE